MSRIDQINSLLKNELAELINIEGILPDGLITVTRVKTSPDLRYAKISVSVLPDNQAGTALKKLRQKSGFFTAVLRKKLKIKFIPKFSWEFDSTEKEAAKIDDLINSL
jgi:ribosome-binding factor A